MNQLCDGSVEGACDLFYQRVRLGVNGGAIERVFSITNAEEAGGLLEGFRADTWDFIELLARAELTVLIAIGDDIERDTFGDAGDVAEERPGGCVEVDADAIHTGLNDGFE